MSNPIVTVLVTQQQAPLPSELQKTGAVLSQGGTVLAVGSSALIQQPSDLTAIQPLPRDLSTLAWAAGLATGTTALDHNIPPNTVFTTTIADTIPDGYNGTFNAISTGATTFTYYIPQPDPDPLDPTTVVAGSYTIPAVSELSAQIKTFFDQGFSQSCYVLELGGPDSTPPTSPGLAVGNLRQFINDNDQIFYSYLVPANWDGLTEFISLLRDFQTTTSKTYFYATTTVATYKTYLNNPDGTSTFKDLITLVDAPTYGAWPINPFVTATWDTLTGHVTATMASTAPNSPVPGDYVNIIADPPTFGGRFLALPGTTPTSLVYAVVGNPGTFTSGTLQASIYTSPGTPADEFTMAAAWWVPLNYTPSNTSRVPPYSYSFLQSVTQFPSPGNKTLMTQLQAANVNIVGFGGEGGISDRILMYGHTMDGRPVNYWYSVDYMQINIDRDIANAIINGSNTTVNPLYYNQDGINRLASVAGQTGTRAIAAGLALGRLVLLGLPQQQFLDNLNKGLYAGTLVVNADPFTNYTANNPTHYRQGLYGGLTMAYTPLRGFEHIIFSIIVTDFVATA